jgi:hypothetical protein
MAPTCFVLRPSSGCFQLSLTKVILILKHAIRLRPNLLSGGVAARPSMACVLCVVQSTAHNTHALTNYDVNLLHVLISI